MQNMKLNSIETSQSRQEEEIFGIVAGQISMESSKEAIKAQCVIARTNYMYALTSGTELPEAFGDDELIRMWGDDYDKNRTLLDTCLNETSGVVMMWENGYAYAPYHMISAGETRSMKENYGEEAVSYVDKTACPKDAKASGYLNIKYFSSEEYGDIADDITQITRDSAGYVMTLVVNGKERSGEDFRKEMGLESSCFSINKKDDGVYIATKGSGHGFGLSQNQADEMARDGMDYMEILQYFFPLIEYKSI
jgi:stage II sporulation protein D